MIKCSYSYSHFQRQFSELLEFYTERTVGTWPFANFFPLINIQEIKNHERLGTKGTLNRSTGMQDSTAQNSQYLPLLSVRSYARVPTHFS